MPRWVLVTDSHIILIPKCYACASILCMFLIFVSPLCSNYTIAMIRYSFKRKIHFILQATSSTFLSARMSLP